jgi:ribonuclease HI
MTDTLKEVIAYTDGGCIGNPGPGGYGVVLVHGGRKKELSGGFRMTTNNRMEVMAAIAALRVLKTARKVTLVTDSRYLSDAMSKGWAKKWRANGWRKSGKGRALNQDLWQQLLDLCEQHRVEFKWIPGHAGHPENERCDALSMRAAQQPDLPADSGYENDTGGRVPTSLLAV